MNDSLHAYMISIIKYHLCAFKYNFNSALTRNLLNCCPFYLSETVLKTEDLCLLRELGGWSPFNGWGISGGLYRNISSLNSCGSLGKFSMNHFLHLHQRGG
jgi:hypothetical protein